MSDTSIARKIALAMLVILVGVSSAVYGSVENGPTEWMLFGSLLCCAPMLWTVSLRRLARGPAAMLVLPLVLVAVWGLVQSMPLPPSIVRALSPAAARIYELTVPPGGGASLPAWLLARSEKDGVIVGDDRDLPPAIPDRGDVGLGKSLSLHPSATRNASILWLSPLLLIAASAWVARSSSSRYILLWGLAGWAALWGVVSILQEGGWSGRPIWTRDIAAAQMMRIARPFINPNHYSSSVAMGSLVAIGLALALLARGTGRLDREGIRAALYDRDWTLPRLITAGILAALGTAGVIISKSRGGILAFACGILFFVAARWMKGWASVAVVLVVLAGLLAGIPAIPAADHAASFANPPFASSGLDPSALMRIDVWGKTLRMFLDFPVSGTGLGTFEWAFNGYQRQGETLAFRQAHNDYVQVLAETGLVGLTLLAWALVVFLLRILVPVLRGVDGEPRWTSIAVAAAAFAVLVHSTLDFNLQIPANAAQFAVLVGILAAAALDDAPDTPAPEEGGTA